MSIRSGLRPAAAMAAVTLLSACFPPFPFPPFGPAGSGERTIVIENATDDDWVLTIEADFPTSFAIPAGATGEVVLLSGEPTSATLKDRECAEVDELVVEGEMTGVRIAEPATLEPLGEPKAGDQTDSFAEFFECGLGGQPEAGDAVAGASGRILLVGSDGSSWILDVASADLAPVADSGPAPVEVLGGEHAFSADGTTVAFTRLSETTMLPSVYLANADGSDERILVENASMPIWSPDGTEIAYLNLDPFVGSSTLSVIDVATGASRNLAEEVLTASWAPDGARLAFMTGSFDIPDPMMTPRTELHVIDADGGGEQFLAEVGLYSDPPAWSPDGSHIAFTTLAGPASAAMMFGDPSVIGLYDLETFETRTLAELDGASLAEPAWSPDGTRLAVTVSPTGVLGGGPGAIGVLAVAGGSLEQLGQADDAWYSRPIWSPDGAWIAAARTVGQSVEGELIAVEASGGDELVLATRVMMAKDWRPAD